MKKFLLFFTFILFACEASAWVNIISPPPEHKIEAGTYAPYKSAGGATRYLEVVESTVCNAKPDLVQPSSTYIHPQGGLYKRYLSPSNVSKPWPVSYAEECAVPESPDTSEPNVPAPVNFVGLHKVSLNPIVGDTKNDCTYAEFEVTEKIAEGRYLFKFLRLYDAATVNQTTGKRECKF